MTGITISIWKRYFFLSFWAIIFITCNFAFSNFVNSTTILLLWTLFKVRLLHGVTSFVTNRCSILLSTLRYKSIFLRMRFFWSSEILTIRRFKPIFLIFSVEIIKHSRLLGILVSAVFRNILYVAIKGINWYVNRRFLIRGQLWFFLYD